jgi:uncharacterized protein YggT (Ycf19 family)
MAFLASLLASILYAGLFAAGGLFALRFLLSFGPGAYFAAFRRRMFLLTQPWLDPVDSWFSLRLVGIECAPLIAALACFLLAHGVAPWLLVLGFRASVG